MDAKEALIESFCRCAETMHFEEISIKEIYTGAKVSKKTYYNYFETKEDIVAAVIKRDFQDPFVLVHECFFGDELKKSNVALREMLFRTFYARRQLYDPLITSLGESRFRDIYATGNLAMSREMYQYEKLEGKLRLEVDFMLHLFARAGVEAILWWRRTGFQLSIEEMGVLYEEWVLANVSRRPEISILFNESARR